MRNDQDFRCFDNGGKTADRYTIVAARKHYRTQMDDRRLWQGFACNDEPFHPQGIGMSCEVATPGKHLGKKVPLSSLPADVQQLARRLFADEPLQMPLL